MPSLEFEGIAYEVGDGETVLSCLERHGHTISNSCRSGVCHSCLMRSVGGDLPAASQRGLKVVHQTQGFFLACQCIPEGDLTIATAEGAVEKVTARVLAAEKLNHRVLRVVLEPDRPLTYFPGQFLNFVRPGGLVRSFSIASVPQIDTHLEFHIALVPGGQMSGWLHEEARPGDAVELQGPHGSCCYTAGSLEQPLLLVGTGTGLAPLWGILRDALAQGHTGPIHLFHGASTHQDLYLTEVLRDLAQANGNFHYHPCLRDDDGVDGTAHGSVDTLAMEAFPDLKGWKVYLCGNPELVRKFQRKAFMAGANMRDIHADAFLPAMGQ